LLRKCNPNGKSTSIQKFYNNLIENAKLDNKYTIKLNEKIFSQTIDSEDKYIYAGLENGDITFIETETGKETKRINGHTKGVNCIVLNKEETTLYSASDDNSIKVWDLQTSTCINTLTGHTDRV